MKTPGWLHRLEDRWKVNTRQAIIILVVFACTGFSVLFLKQPLLSFFGPREERSIWLSILYYLFIFPLYNVLLLFYGFVFGQFSFFWNFEKRFFRRLAGKKNSKSEADTGADKSATF